MTFPNETPLEDVIKYIRSCTKSSTFPEGIPIYVDPVGLQEAEKTMASTVTFDLKQVALRTSLKLILKQLGHGLPGEGRPAHDHLAGIAG